MSLINDSGEIRRIFRPLAKSWWLIVSMTALGAYNGYQSFLTETPSFQARSTIQVNDKNSSPSTFLEKLETFSMVGEYLLELEIIRSTYLIRQAVYKLPIKVAYWTMTDVGWRQDYKKLPFKLKYEMADSSWLDVPFFVDVKTDGTWDLHFDDLSGQPAHMQLKKGEAAEYRDLNFRLIPTQGDDISPGSYQFIIRSDEGLMAIFADMSNLLVRLQYEKVALINIYYWHPVPELATDFVNELAKIYIDDFLVRKKEMAKRAMGTLETQISTAEQMLEQAEVSLYSYRDQVKVWNVSSFRKLQLDLLKETEAKHINSRLKIENLQKLDSLLSILAEDQEAEINYESVRDAAYLDALEQIVKIQLLLRKSRSSLTDEHPKIIGYLSDIRRIVASMQIRVKRTLQTQRLLQKELDGQLTRFRGQILRLPEIEQELSHRVRNIAFKQRVLDSLNVKMIDAYISTMADFTFHRILEYELVPEEPIKPLIHVKVGVTSLMYTLYAIFFLLFLQGFKGVLTHADDVYEYLELPVRTEAQLNPFPQIPISQGFMNLAADLILDQQVQILSLFDFKTHEDKIKSSYQLGYAFAQLDQQTLLLQADEEIVIDPEEIPQHPNLDILQFGQGEDQFPAQIIHHKDWEQTLAQFCKQYDFIILLVSGIKKTQDVLPFMLYSDLNLYVATLYRTRVSKLQKARDYLQDNDVPNTEILLLSYPAKNRIAKLITLGKEFYHRYRKNL